MNIHSRPYRLDPTPLEKGVVTSVVYTTRQTQTTIQFCIKYFKKNIDTFKYDLKITIFFFQKVLGG